MVTYAVVDRGPFAQPTINVMVEFLSQVLVNRDNLPVISKSWNVTVVLPGFEGSKVSAGRALTALMTSCSLPLSARWTEESERSAAQNALRKQTVSRISAYFKKVNL